MSLIYDHTGTGVGLPSEFLFSFFYKRGAIDIRLVIWTVSILGLAVILVFLDATVN